MPFVIMIFSAVRCAERNMLLIPHYTAIYDVHLPVQAVTAGDGIGIRHTCTCSMASSGIGDMVPTVKRSYLQLCRCLCRFPVSTTSRASYEA